MENITEHQFPKPNINPIGNSVLVTGGAGYIGSHFCKYAKSKGHQIFIIDNLSTGYKEFVKWGDLFLIDVRETNKLYKILSKAQWR